MPQIVQPQYIPGPQYRGFFQTGLGQLAGSAIAPLFSMAGQGIGEMINGPSRDDQLKDIALEQNKNKEAQDVNARFASNQLTPEQRQSYFDSHGIAPDDAMAQPGIEQKMREQMLSNTAKEAGFDPNTNQWAIPNAGQGSVPISATPGELNVKSANPGDYDPALAAMPGYNQKFMPQSAGAKFDVSKLTPEQQKIAGVISQRTMAFQKTMQLFDNKDTIPTPEQTGALHAGLRSTEQDINKIVDMYNETHTPGDANMIKAQGGIINLGLGWQELAFRGSPAYMATLKTPEAAQANTERIKQLQQKFQHLNEYEAGRVIEFAKRINDGNVKTFLDYSNNEQATKAKVYDTNVTHIDNAKQNEIRVASLNHDIQKTMMEMTHKDFANQMEASKFNLEVMKQQLEAQHWAKQIDMGQNKNAIDLYSAIAADRNSEADRRLKGWEVVLASDTKMDVANLKGMSKTANLFSALKGMQGLPQLYQMFAFSKDAKSKEFAEQLKGTAGAQLSEAMAIPAQGSTVENIIEMIPGVKQLLPNLSNIPPEQARNIKGNVVKDYLSTNAHDQIKTLLQQQQVIPPELLNLRYSLLLKNNGTMGWDNNYIKDSSDTVNVNGVAMKSREETISAGVQHLLYNTKGSIKSFQEFMNTELPGTGQPLKNVPEFKDPGVAQKFWSKYTQLSQEMR